jgi:hypothetical protein
MQEFIRLTQQWSIYLCKIQSEHIVSQLHIFIVIVLLYLLIPDLHILNLQGWIIALNFAINV